MSCNHDCTQGRDCICQRDIEEGFDTWDQIFDRICLGIGIGLMAVGATIGVVLVVVGMAS